MVVVMLFVHSIPNAALITAQVQSISTQQPRTADGPKTKPRMAACIVGAADRCPILWSTTVYTSIPNFWSAIEAQGLLQRQVDLFVHVSVGSSNISKMRAAMNYLQPISSTL